MVEDISIDLWLYAFRLGGKNISIDLWHCTFMLGGSSQASHIPVV